MLILRPFLGAAALLPLLLGGPVMARNGAAHGFAPAAAVSAFSAIEPAAPAGHGDAVWLAQATDPRVDNLSEQIRQLNGKIEELNFQVLQMQDKMNKMQEDNEFRFQQLEKGRGGGSGAADQPVKEKRSDAKTDRATADNSAPSIRSIIQAPDNSGGDSVAEGDTSGSVEGRGAPPRSLGSITFDSNGNPVNSTLDENGQPVSRPSAGDNASGGGTAVAALPSTDDPNELYRNSYQFILSGDYKTAEAGFREHIKRYPDDPRAADAHFWLGESLLGQDRYREAAQVFLDANRTYPKSKKAPDMLLKLGVALAAMHQRDIACATYKEIGTKYPQSSSALKERVKQEQALSGC